MSGLVTFLALPFTLTWKGFVISKLWGWFLVPLALPPIGIAHAVGISTLAALLTMKVTHKDAEKRTDKQTIDVIVLAVLWPLMALGIGFITQLFLS